MQPSEILTPMHPGGIMSPIALPSTDQAYIELINKGWYLAPRARDISNFGEITLARKAGRGAERVKVDWRLVKEAQQVFAGDEIRDTFIDHGVPAQPASDVLRLIGQYFNRGLVWGFSGESSRQTYATEGRALRSLLTSLTETFHPSLIVNIAKSEGVPALGSVAARKYQIPSLGLVPQEGLAGIGYQTYLLASQRVFASCSPLLGAASDILVCIGGDSETQAACETTLSCGGVVILMALREYSSPSFVHTYRSHGAMAKAEIENRLFVCRNARDIMAAGRQALNAGRRIAREDRVARLQLLARRLAK